MADIASFKPDWVSPPGDTIADALDEASMSQADLARRTGFTRKHINGLINGNVAITADAALRLETVLGGPVSFWLQREAQYREALARRAALAQAESDMNWLVEFPLTWMVKQGWLRKWPRKAEQVEECLRFYGVASVQAWRETFTAPLAAFRASPKFDKEVGAVAAWLRKAELQAGEIDCAPYDKEAFRDALPTLRGLTTATDPRTFVPKLQDACAVCGVAVVFTPAPPRCPVSGATRWLNSDKALLALSLRHKTNDHLWFSFFHEAAHLLKHGKRLLFVDGLDGLDELLEEEANRLARDLLIAPRDVRILSTMTTSAEIKALAEEIGIAPGILVGRMQHEGWIGWNRMNGMKVRYEWGNSH